jgi:voltage-gated potassium channel Kch
LRHHGLGQARVILSTVGNTFLRGITNEQLLQVAKAIKPEAHFIATAESPEEAERLLRQGAFAVVSPSQEASVAFAAALHRAVDAGG